MTAPVELYYYTGGVFWNEEYVEIEPCGQFVFKFSTSLQILHNYTTSDKIVG